MLLDRVRGELAAGEVNLHLVRASFPQLTDRQFGLAVYAVTKELQRSGLFLKPVPGKPGVRRVATAENVAEKALNGSRRAVVNKIRQRSELLVNAQKHKDLDEGSRQKINAEEVVYSRFVQVAERMLLKSERKVPEGLE